MTATSVLMLNGEFDQVFPLEIAQKPMFQLFGAPSDDKFHYIAPAGNVVPRDEVIRRSLAWYDKTPRYARPVGHLDSRNAVGAVSLRSFLPD